MNTRSMLLAVVAGAGAIFSVTIQAQTISTFAGGGRYTDSVALDVSLPTELYAMAVASDGTLYYASLATVYRVDHTTGHVAVIAGDGTIGYSGDGGPATAAKLGHIRGMAVDDWGTLYISDSTNAIIRCIDVYSGSIWTCVGDGSGGYTGDGGPAASAGIGSPRGLAIQPGTRILFIGDEDNMVIRRVDEYRNIDTIAGSGCCGYGGDGGLATSAQLDRVQFIAADPNGNVYVANSNGLAIRRIDAASGIIDRFAGDFTSGYSGDGGPANGAALGGANGITTDLNYNVYICDYGNNVIRRVDGASGIITTIAGTGAAGSGGDGGPAGLAQFSAPYWLGSDAAANLFVYDSGNSAIRRINAATGMVTRAAGNGKYLYSGDGGPATAANLSAPSAVVVDASGNAFVADRQNQVIRRIDAATGIISNIAGNGSYGLGGDGGPATSAQLGNPYDIALDSAGNLYIADSSNNVVRRVDAASGTITRFAGYGDAISGYSGDGGPATNAGLNDPSSLALDAAGNLYINDRGNYVVRRVDAATKLITTIAGTGAAGYSGDGGLATSAALIPEYGLALDATGNLYIADGSSVVRRIDAATGIITTVAGNGTLDYTGDGGLAVNASLLYPRGLAVDAAGNLYIADQGNSVVRRVDAGTGTITTVAGNGTFGFSGDGGSPLAAELNSPEAVALNAAGDLFIADTGNNRIRVVTGLSLADTTPPVITPVVTGTGGANGWYTSDVTVSWTVMDAESSVSNQTGCADVIVNTDTGGLPIICSATSSGGTASQSVTVKRDTTTPVAIATALPVPNSNGWNNSTVTVHFSGTGGVSGIASCHGDITMTAEGASQSSSAGTCTDFAGKVSTPVIATGINIDETAPTASGAATPNPNAAGWYRSAATVNFTALDSLSNVTLTPCTPPSVVITTQGTGQSATSTCSDKAGNTVSPTVGGINIDTVAPTAVATGAPAANLAGWNNTNVTVTFSGTDTFGASGVSACTPPAVVTTEVTGQVASGTCTDVAGNISAIASRAVSIDRTAPTISVVTPASGGSYVSGATVSASYTCADGRSGLATCVGTVANGAALDTTGIGSKSFTVNSTDAAGNPATFTMNYSVVAAVPAFTLTPALLPFGSSPLNTNTTLAILLGSIGTASLPITSIVISGGNAGQFSQTNNCGTSVAVGASCTINVVFRPTSPGAKSSSVTVTASGGAGTKSASLAGVGVVPTYTFTPSLVGFGNQAVTGSSGSQAVTVTNTSTIALPIVNISLNGGNANQFSQTNTCGTLVPVGGTCTVAVVFQPTSTGAKSSSVRLTAGGGAAAQSVTVSGTGVAPTYNLSSTSLAFGNQLRNTNSIARAITLTNTGTLTLPVTSITLTGANSGQFSQTNNCGTSVPVGNACIVSVRFRPTSAGSKSANVRFVLGGGAMTPAIVALTGAGT